MVQFYCLHANGEESEPSLTPAGACEKALQEWGSDGCFEVLATDGETSWFIVLGSAGWVLAKEAL